RQSGHDAVFGQYVDRIVELDRAAREQRRDPRLRAAADGRIRRRIRRTAGQIRQLERMRVDRDAPSVRQPGQSAGVIEMTMRQQNRERRRIEEPFGLAPNRAGVSAHPGIDECPRSRRGFDEIHVHHERAQPVHTVCNLFSAHELRSSKYHSAHDPTDPSAHPCRVHHRNRRRSAGSGAGALRPRGSHGPRGPLHGIPILIKDNIATADRMMTTAGSLALAGSKPPKDAFIVRRLREAGAIILGKTNLSEWANFRSTHSTSGWSGRGGLTKNPYALDRNPSGSSSGSGAAAAANLCAAAVGTETDGSIVSPSNNNSLVGIKPTLGLVSRSGIVPIAHSQDTAGPM